MSSRIDTSVIVKDACEHYLYWENEFIAVFPGETDERPKFLARLIQEAIDKALAMSPINLQWSREKPKVDGWYWRKSEFHQTPFTVIVRVAGYNSNLSLHPNGQWAGPLVEPSPIIEPPEVKINLIEYIWDCPRCKYISTTPKLQQAICETCSMEVKLKC
jgi:hypothetical protein